MPFDFFNTSALAFGTKLTSAFTQLDNLRKNAQRNIDDILEAQDIFQEVIGRNYQVPAPVKPTSACRTNEIFAIIENKVYIRSLGIVNNVFKVDIEKLDSLTNRVTAASGETDLREGYVFVKLAISNEEMNKQIRFSKKNDKESSETLLFGFIIDEDDKVTLRNDYSYLELYPQDYTQYRTIEKGDNITLPYIATDYCCICVVGNVNWIEVKKNNKVILSGSGNRAVRHAIIYLKPGDEVSGTYSKAFRLKYN